MKSKIGQKVRLRQSYAKWYLDHPEIYESSDGTVDIEYEEQTPLHLVCCLGEPVYGKILRFNSTTNNCWLIEFRVGNLKARYYCTKGHIDFL